MMKIVIFAFISCVFGASTVFKEESDSESLRYFEFPEGEQAQQQQQGTDFGTSDTGDPTFRQGITNGTVIIIPTINPYIVNNNGTNCNCIPTGSSCSGTSSGSTNYGDNQLDVRIVNTFGGINTGSALSGSVSNAINTATGSQFSSCSSSVLQLCCLSGGYQCGRQYPAVSGSPTPPSGSAYFGQYPWQVVLLTTGDVYVGSGVLIDNYNVLTVAHRISGYTGGRFLKVRLGEWDAASTREPIPAQEFTVSRIFIHPNYVASNLRNDIAVLRLSTRVNLGQTPTITTACMTSSLVSSGRCYVSGWGRNAFNNGQYQSVQKQTDVPIIDQSTCQSQLRNTRLGSGFTLDTTSFICAGGEAGKDACTGDGGAPLVCNINGQFYVVGLVAWGIGCGTSTVPGVYVNVASYIQWIQSTLFQ
ncbi:phenoloxidase-activating factor 2-like [Culicoides brevitarsis]|uniref:phenoloxidase-activating factor 2-like n=1 Tax=Culicoides brevitarsis TaxID=469753 RepID=UPI00307CBF90